MGCNELKKLKDESIAEQIVEQMLLKLANNCVDDEIQEVEIEIDGVCYASITIERDIDSWEYLDYYDGVGSGYKVLHESFECRNVFDIDTDEPNLNIMKETNELLKQYNY